MTDLADGAMLYDVATKPSIGHNIGTVPSPEVIAEFLAESYQGDVQRANDLAQAFLRVPDKIEDEETNKRAADFAKKIAAHMKVLEGGHGTEKRPYLDGGRAVDGFFKGMIDTLKQCKTTVESRQTQFARTKADAERRRREEEARLAREQAEREAQEALERASAMPTKEANAALDSAIAAQDHAETLADAAQANAADLSRTRTDNGVVSSLKTQWKGELTDRNTLDLDKLRPYLPLDALDKAISAYVRAGGRELAGANIFEDMKVVNR